MTGIPLETIKEWIASLRTSKRQWLYGPDSSVITQRDTDAVRGGKLNTLQAWFNFERTRYAARMKRRLTRFCR